MTSAAVPGVTPGAQAMRPHGPETPITILLAGAEDECVARAILPEAFREHRRRVVVLAQRQGQTVGAAVITRRPPGAPRGMRLWLKVVRPHRRRGVGTALLNGVAAEAARYRLPTLFCWEEPNDPSFGQFLQNRGFTAARKIMTFEADTTAYARLVEPIVRRLRARKGLAGTDIIPLHRASAEAVARLYCQGVGGSIKEVIARIRGHGQSPFDPESPVLVRGDRILAVLLHWPEGDKARLEAVVVLPEARGLGANALLIEHAAAQVAARGVDRVRFSCHDGVRDTLKMAARCNAVTVDTRTLYQLTLSGDQDAGQ